MAGHIVGIDVIIAEVADMERAARFYRDALGLAPVVEGDHWTEFDVGGVRLALHPPFVEGALPATRPGWTLCLRVDDLAAIRQRLEAHGAAILGEPHEVPGGISQTFADPDGHQLQAIQRPATDPGS